MVRNAAIPDITGTPSVTLAPVSAPRLQQPPFKLAGNAHGTLVNFHYLQQANQVINELKKRLAAAEEERDRAMRRNETMAQILRVTAEDLAEARKVMETRNLIEADVLQSIAELEDKVHGHRNVP